jgi:hypothetical protein
MSLLLSWETQPEILEIATATLRRRYESHLPYQVVATGMGWGFYEDTSPGADYEVDYYRDNGTLLTTVKTEQIRKWERPAASCKVSFSYLNPNSTPWRLRKIKFLSIPTHTWVQDIFTGRDGKCEAVFAWGSVLRMEVEGEDKALEFGVPKLHYVDADELGKWGSFVRMDNRSIR